MANDPDNLPPSEEPVLARPVLPATALLAEAPRPWSDLSAISRPGAVLDLLLVLVVVLTPYVLHMFLGLAFADAEQEIPAARMLQYQKWSEMLIASVLLGYLILRHKLPPAAFGLRLRGLPAQLGLAPVTLVGVYIAFIPSVIITMLIIVLFPAMQQDLQGRYHLITALSEQSFADTVWLMIPVAIHEEIVFRGLFIPYLKRVGMGWVGAALVSSAVFAALHIAQGWLGIFQVFSLGLAFAAAFILTRSLLVVALAHFGFNTIQLAIAPMLLKWAEQSGGIPGA